MIVEFDARRLASEKRRLDRISEREANTTCFACRSQGHSAKDCPNNLDGSIEIDGIKTMVGRDTVNICYRFVFLLACLLSLCPSCPCLIGFGSGVQVWFPSTYPWTLSPASEQSGPNAVRVVLCVSGQRSPGWKVSAEPGQGGVPERREGMHPLSG